MRLLVPFSALVTANNSIEALSLQADSLDKHRIEMHPWPVFEYKPTVSFAIAYGHNCILLKYFVAEKNISAVYCNPNEPVYKDSCVEFFVSFGKEREYYNFEFNCIGTCLLGFGINRAKRTLLPEAIIKKINTQSVIASANSTSDTNVNWQLTIMIPFEVFRFHTFSSLKNQDCKVNFYKCGDNLPDPHFLSWNNIKAENPDFHLSEYFGEMKFV